MKLGYSSWLSFNKSSHKKPYIWSFRTFEQSKPIYQILRFTCVLHQTSGVSSTQKQTVPKWLIFNRNQKVQFTPTRSSESHQQHITYLNTPNEKVYRKKRTCLYGITRRGGTHHQAIWAVKKPQESYVADCGVEDVDPGHRRCHFCLLPQRKSRCWFSLTYLIWSCLAPEKMWEKIQWVSNPR